MNKKIALIFALIILLLLILGGCVPGDGTNSETKPAGFFWGIWHGWIAPISLIASVFMPDIGMYEIHNSGFWYDLGYYMAIISGFGGLALFRHKSKNNNRSE